MPFYIFAWIASFLFGLETLVGKLTSKYAIKNPWLYNFGWSLLVLIFTIPFALISGVSWPSAWLNIIIMGFFYSLSYIFYALTLYQMDISAFTPLFNLRAGITLILSALLLGEVLSLEQYLLILLMMAAGMIISLAAKFHWRALINRGMIYMLLDIFALSLWGIYTKKAILETGYWECTLWGSIICQIFLLPTLTLCYKEITKINIKQLGACSLVALMGTVGTLASFKSTAVNVSITSAILSIPFSMIIVAIVSIIKPGFLEKNPPKVYAIRFVAAAIMIWAALQLSS